MKISCPKCNFVLEVPEGIDQKANAVKVVPPEPPRRGRPIVKILIVSVLLVVVIGVGIGVWCKFDPAILPTLLKSESAKKQTPAATAATAQDIADIFSGTGKDGDVIRKLEKLPPELQAKVAKLFVYQSISEGKEVKSSRLLTMAQIDLSTDEHIHIKCPACGGSGYPDCQVCNNTRKCFICNGTGKKKVFRNRQEEYTDCRKECRCTLKKCRRCNGSKTIVNPDLANEVSAELKRIKSQLESQ